MSSRSAWQPSKQSINISYLGSVPPGWTIGRLKYSLSINPSHKECGAVPSGTKVPFFAMESIGDDGALKIEAEKSFEEASKAYTYFKNDDVIIAKVTPCFENGKGALVKGLEGGYGFGTTELVVLRASEKLNAKFLYYISLSNEVRHGGTAFMTGAGGLKRVPDDFYLNLVWPLPSISEQIKIVNFLDRETSKIDELIQKQEKLIELIQELQQAKILMCVTRGIKPVAKLKKSTNIWLDEIPSSWGEGNLKVLSKIYSGGTPDKSKQEYWTNGTIPWLNSGSVNDFYIFEPSEYITVEALSKSSAKWIKSGSVLVALAGQGKTKGMAAQLMFDSTCNQSMCAIVPSEKLNSNYLLWWLSANYQNIRNLAGGDLRDGLNLEMIGSIKCPLPSINEQIEIAKYLDSVKEKNLHLIERCKKSIELLTEHRSSLISAAVTGKIDVREVA